MANNTEKSIQNGNYISLSQLQNGNLKITLSSEGREFLQENSHVMTENCFTFHKSHSDLLHELFDDIRANSEIELLSEYDGANLGCLTSSPLIGFDVDRDDTGEITGVSELFWFPEYQIKSELEELLTNGFVIFTKSDN